MLQTEGSGAIGSGGGGLGYGKGASDPGDPIRHSFAVEFDAWSNSGDGFDPSRQHVAVTTNGDVTQHLAWRDPGFSMHSHGSFDVWITYDASRRTLLVWAGQPANQRGEPLLRFQVDLTAALGGKPAFVGFTAGTGRILNTNPQVSILNWDLVSG